MKTLKFEYQNWKGEKYEYAIIPITVQYGENKLYHASKSWNITGLVLTRDGVVRNVIRTFAMIGMRNISEAPIEAN